MVEHGDTGFGDGDVGCGEREMGDEGGHNAGEEERGEETGVLPVGRLVATF